MGSLIERLPSAERVPTLTAAQMAEVDRAAVEELGLSTEMLMENAARGVADAVGALLGSVPDRVIVCLVGTGNNGGDALAAARRLHVWGANVRCVLAAPRDRLRGDLTRRHHDIAQKRGIPLVGAERASFEGADLILDGLLGFSVHGAPTGNVELLIRQADRSRVPILAIDLPSGLDPDTGAPLGIAIRAEATVTLGLPKSGLVEPHARPLVGELLLADIGMPPAVYDRFGIDARKLFRDGPMLRVPIREARQLE